MALFSWFLIALFALNVNCENVTMSADMCPVDTSPVGPWSALLEEWATSAPTATGRQGRIMALPTSQGYYVTDRVDAPPVRAYDEWPAPPPPPPGAGKIVNRPSSPYKDKFKPSYPFPQQKPVAAPRPPPHQYPAQAPYGPAAPPGPPLAPPPGPQRPPQHPVDRLDEPQRRVTETDLYLLGAIEKLVYRVDFMEKRLRKLEESLHYLVAGSDPKPEPCVDNFVRVGGTCYHFSPESYDWKTANLACRKLRANLLELESDTERRKLFATMQTEKGLKGSDWWTGGLNPGLLWIWSNSARPVAANATADAANTASTAANSTHSITIIGEGRCLSLVLDPATRTHVFRGHDCALRHRYICEKTEDKTRIGNEIERVSRQLKLDDARKPKIMWAGDGR